MSGAKFLLDTNIIINHLYGNYKIESLLQNSFVYISAITYSELLCGNISEQEKKILDDYLTNIHVEHTNDFICESAAELRKRFKIKLPDPLIASTSIFLNIPLVTADDDFDKVDDLHLIKFEL